MSPCIFTDNLSVCICLYLRSDDQLELVDVSDGEQGAVLSTFSRIQSRLNPVPESLNSPDIVPGDACYIQTVPIGGGSNKCLLSDTMISYKRY